MSDRERIEANIKMRDAFHALLHEFAGTSAEHTAWDTCAARTYADLAVGVVLASLAEREESNPCACHNHLNVQHGLKCARHMSATTTSESPKMLAYARQTLRAWRDKYGTWQLVELVVLFALVAFIVWQSQSKFPKTY